MKSNVRDKKDLLGRKIKAVRRAAGFTQVGLAKKIKASSSSIVRWELGESAPQERILKAIAHACGVPIGALPFTSERKAKIKGKRGGPTGAEIATRLRQLRGQMLQRDFARKIGVMTRAYLRYESGERNLRDFQIRAICEACGVSADWLLFGARRPEGRPAKSRARGPRVTSR